MFEAALLQPVKVLLSPGCSCVFLDIFSLVNVYGVGTLNQGRCSHVTSDERYFNFTACHLVIYFRGLNNIWDSFSGKSNQIQGRSVIFTIDLVII